MDKILFDLHIAAGKTAGIERTCGKKVKYEEASAIKAAEVMNLKPTTRKKLEAYPCAFCSKWHVGREMSMSELRSNMSKELKPETIIDGISINPTACSLVISEDTGENNEPTAVFLFTPDLRNMSEHFHIETDVEHAKKLHDWLGRFLNKHTEGKPCRAEPVGFENAHPVKCPCGCKDGVLQSDGRNVQNNLTFLACSSCGCTYVANDVLVST